MANIVISRIQNRRGTQAEFDALYPTYPGTGPNILQAGEIAICTDTNSVYMGGLGGRYVRLMSGFRSAEYTPLQVLLQPISTPTPIPNLTYTLSPFLSIKYSLTDATTSGGIPATATTPGNTFSKNGELQITATTASASLSDISTEIKPSNGTLFANFTASVITEGTVNKIRLSYTHNSNDPLTFSTASIIWNSI